MGKLSDNAHKYDSIQDEILADENDVWDDEDTLIMKRPAFPTEQRYPGVGILLTFTFGILFWATLVGLLFRK
jgi:hypothetical protein